MKIPAYSFAFAGLLLSSLAVAQDQPQNAFYPSQSWQVTKNPYQAVSTVEYCGLSNRFNNGFDFQIIGSEKWIDAVDIDFAQDVFVSGKEYSVDFAVPGEMQASLLGEARNAQTLTIDISGRKDLYNAVKQVAVTDLKIEGNEFRFYLVGIAGRIPEFEQCMADIAAPDSSALAGAVPPAPVEADPIDTSASPDAAASLPDESLLVGAPDALPDSTIEAAQMEEDQRRSLSEEGPIALAPPPVERVQPDQVGVLAERLSPQEEPETDAGPEEGTDDAGLSVSASMNDVEEPVLAKPQERERFTQAIDQQLRRADVPEPLSENPVSANPGLEDDGLEDEEPETAEAESAPLQPEKLPPILKTEETASESQEEVAEKPAPRPGFYTPADLARLASGQDVDPLETMPEEFRPVSQNTDPASGNYPANDPANDIELPPIDIEELTAQPPVEPQEMANETPTEMTGAGEIIVEVHEDPSEGVALADKEAQAAASGEETAIIPETPDTGSGIRARTPEISVTRETQRIEADFTRFPEEARSEIVAQAIPEGEADMPRVGELARKISDLESQLAMLEQENAALNADLEAALQESESERLSISSENWNLERATMRFHEAERQIKRLGQQLQKERAMCAMEKRELEAMLFDPQLTTQAQLARLSELEAELAEARAQLQGLRN